MKGYERNGVVWRSYGAWLRSKNIHVGSVADSVLSSSRLERRWQRDMPAYKRLREDGLQPPRIDGCADLEVNASTRFEVESGRAYPGKEKQLSEAVDFFEQGTGRSVFTPAVE